MTREELYSLVWSKPMIKLAEEFKVSGSYLARVCTLLNVPRPTRGYWALLAVGKAPNAIPLPDPRPGDPMSWVRDGENIPSLKPRAPASDIPRPKAVIKVPKNSIHGLIREGREHFDVARVRDDDPYLKPAKKLLVDVTCSRDCLDKALGFANDLFIAFESRGHRVVLAPSNERLSRAQIEERESNSNQRAYGRYPSLWSPHRPTVVYIGTVAFGLAIVEMSEEALMRYVNGKYIRDADYAPPKLSRRSVDHSWTTTRDMPSGRLRLFVYCPYHRVKWSHNWQATKRSDIGGQISEIVKTVEGSAQEIVSKLEEAGRQAEIERQRWEEQQDKYRKDEDRRQIEKSIEDSKGHLRQIIQRWSSLLEVERFLEGVDARSAQLMAEERDQVQQRLKLAREFLGNVDPLQFFLGWKTPTERYQPRYELDHELPAQS